MIARFEMRRRATCAPMFVATLVSMIPATFVSLFVATLVPTFVSTLASCAGQSNNAHFARNGVTT
jgi:hypothetical protein